jgi:hypothetical protein
MVMRELGKETSRLVGVIQLRVGARVFALPVEEATLTSADGSKKPGGFFFEGPNRFGILVDRDVSEAERTADIQKASLEAASVIARKFLN